MRSFFIVICAFLSISNVQAQVIQDKCIDITFRSTFEGWRAGGSTLNARELFAFLNQVDQEAFIQKYISAPYMRNAWGLMKIPHVNARIEGLYHAMIRSIDAYKLRDRLQPTKESWMNETLSLFSPEGLEWAKQNLSSYYENTYIAPNDLIAKLKAPKNDDETSLVSMFKRNPFLKVMACSSLAPFEIQKCQKALVDTLERISSGPGYHIGEYWMADILGNMDAAPGAFKLTSRILKRIEEHDFSQANLIDDAYESFALPEGRTKNTDKMAETFILLAFAHGQITWESLRYYAIQNYNHPILFASFTVSMIATYLDSLLQANNPQQSLYSTPGLVSDVCDNGKSYHFLVPWFISKRLQEEGYSKNISTQVPFMIEWAYQGFSNSLGRSPLKNVRAHVGDIINLSNRLDLMYSGYGVLLATKQLSADKTYDFSAAFNQTLSDVPRKFEDPIGDEDLDPDSTSGLLKIANFHQKRFNREEILDTLKKTNTKN